LTPDNERAVKHWGTLDAMALMRQIGAIPEPSAAR
jgi:predicted ester cyclase